jgi:hypothetical protein
LRKQKEIQKSNEFYLELIEKALPLELQQIKKKDKFKGKKKRQTNLKKKLKYLNVFFFCFKRIKLRRRNLISKQ